MNAWIAAVIGVVLSAVTHMHLSVRCASSTLTVSVPWALLVILLATSAAGIALIVRHLWLEARPVSTRSVPA